MARAKPKVEALTADDLYARLGVRYALPEWGLFRQVCEAGTGGRRYADAVAMNLFPSRGMEVEGFEIKVSRGDWLREKRDPAKADELARFCDRWWVVASGPDVVGIGELPPTWGLIVPRGDGLITKTPAPKLTPEPLSKGFIATVIRRTLADERFSYELQVRAAVAEAVREAEARWNKEHAQFEANVSLFEEVSGLHISRRRNTWDEEYVRKLGGAVRLVLEGKHESEDAERSLRHLLKTAERITGEIREALAAALPAAAPAAKDSAA
jgi:hypothetical protein